MLGKVPLFTGCIKKNYDFARVLDYMIDGYFYSPWDWQIENPRAFFEEIYRIAKEVWKDDLEKASKEDPSTW